MINLVFTHILDDEYVSVRMTILGDIMSHLLSDDNREVLKLHCLAVVQTRSVYAVDILSFISQRIDDVDHVLEKHRCDPVRGSLKTLSWVLPPLKLFSFSMESWARLSQEVLPNTTTVSCEYQYVRPRLTQTEDIHMLDKLIAHFIGRLRINAFEDTVTAWVLRIDRRERFRTQAAHFWTVPLFLHRIPVVQDQFEPWNPREVSVEQEDGITINALAEEMNAPFVPGFDTLETRDDAISSARATFVADQPHEFQRILAEQDILGLNERLLIQVERGALHVGITQVRTMASTLDLNPQQVVEKLMSRLFTDETPNAPPVAVLHWRGVHASRRTSVGLARICV
jgi:hypothetical protein